MAVEKQLPPGALLAMLVSLARLGSQPRGAWWARMREAAAAAFPDFAPPQLPRLLRAMACLGHRPPAPWLRACLLATLRRVPAGGFLGV